MKKAITFWVEDDVEVVALCGTLMLKHTENMEKNYGADGAQMFNFSQENIKPDLFCPINGNIKEIKEGDVVDE